MHRPITASGEDRDLLEQVFTRLRGRGGDGTVEEGTIGERLVAVELDGAAGRSMGVAHRPPGELEREVPSEPLAVARWAIDPPTPTLVEAALGIAAMNAVSAPVMNWRDGDPMAALTDEVERIATVGLFRPAFRLFDSVDVHVIERTEIGDIEPPDNVSVTFFPPGEYERAISGVDVVFVTGSSLVYRGTTTYVRAASRAGVPAIVLIGATASFLPGPVFDAGVTIMAGVEVTDHERVRAGIEAGGCATDLHGRGLTKNYVSAEPIPDGLDLVPGPKNSRGSPD